MDDIKRGRLKMIVQQLMQAHDALIDSAPIAAAKKNAEEDALLSDALDSLGESISCLTELLEEESK